LIVVGSYPLPEKTTLCSGGFPVTNLHRLENRMCPALSAILRRKFAL
jgi:hypothetical protein